MAEPRNRGGRPTHSAEGAKVRVTFSLSPEAARAIDALPNRSAHVDALIRKDLL